MISLEPGLRKNVNSAKFALGQFGEMLMLATCQFSKFVLSRLLFGYMGISRSICNLCVFITKNTVAAFPEADIKQSNPSIVQNDMFGIQRPNTKPGVTIVGVPLGEF